MKGCTMRSGKSIKILLYRSRRERMKSCIKAVPVGMEINGSEEQTGAPESFVHISSNSMCSDITLVDSSGLFSSQIR